MVDALLGKVAAWDKPALQAAKAPANMHTKAALKGCMFSSVVR
jgi:hypothetical protein